MSCTTDRHDAMTRLAIRWSCGAAIRLRAELTIAPIRVSCSVFFDIGYRSSSTSTAWIADASCADESDDASTRRRSPACTSAADAIGEFGAERDLWHAPSADLFDSAAHKTARCRPVGRRRDPLGIYL